MVAARKTPVVDGYCLLLLLGYGLFRTLMNSTYSSAMSTVRNVSPIAVANLEFSTLSSFSILLTTALLAVLGCLRPRTRLRRTGLVSASVLTVMNLCSGLGLFAGLQGDAATLLLAAAWGVTSIAANAAWLIPFADLGPRRCLTTLIASILVSSLSTLFVGGLPSGAQGFALTVVGAGSVALFLVGSLPADYEALEGASAEPAASPSATARGTLHLLGELWGPLVVYASLTMLSGFAAAFLGTAAEVSTELPVNNIAALAAVVFLAMLAFVSNRMFDLKKTFRMAFPFMALALAVLPFVDHSYGVFFRSALTFLNTIVNVSMLFLLLETTRVRRASPVAVVASAMFIARLALLTSMLVGGAIDAQHDLDDTVRALILVAVGIYLLSMALMLLTRKQGQRAGLNVSVSLASDEVTFNRPESAYGNEDADGTAAAGAAEKPETAATEKTGAPQPSTPDALARRADELAAQHHLTQREREVVLLLAQGRSAPFIGGELGLSTNTVRGYIQEAYAKLDVHSKQELINLLTE